jgi:hypothetical protein
MKVEVPYNCRVVAGVVVPIPTFPEKIEVDKDLNVP